MGNFLLCSVPSETPTIREEQEFNFNDNKILRHTLYTVCVTKHSHNNNYDPGLRQNILCTYPPPYLFLSEKLLGKKLNKNINPPLNCPEFLGRKMRPVKQKSTVTQFISAKSVGWAMIPKFLGF